MSSDQDPAKANPSKPQSQQTAVSGVTARDIQIGQIVQKIAYLGLPFNSQHLRFAQFVANTVYAILLLGGFLSLWQQGADGATLLLLFLGSGLLCLTCVYYAWFWKPEVQDKGTPSSEPADADASVQRQQTKHRSRQRTRRSAMVGIIVIPLLTWGGFFVWRSLPAPHVLLLVANFDGVEQQNYRVTETILRNLRTTTQPYADVKVQALNQTITERQGSEVARAAGEQKKATIVIWGEYGVTPTNVQISVHFELLKPPNYFPKLEETASGKAQIAAIAELNSFKLQTRLSKEMSYLTLFTLGMAQYAREDWEGAISRFNDALAQIDTAASVLDQSVVLFYRGNSYYSKSDYPKAIADYNRAIKLQPDFAGAYNNRGNAYLDQGNSTQAIADLNQAIKLKPDDALAYYNRGIAYRDQGNLTQAITDYTQAIKLQPDFALAYNNRGNAYRKQGNYTQAITDYTQAIKLQPDFAGAYNNRGIAYRKQGNYTQAIADLNQAIKLQSNDAFAYYNRGIAYSNQGNFTQAIADFNQAIKLQPDFAGAYNNRGIAYGKQGNSTQAIADLNQAIELQPDFAGAYNNRGIAYRKQGNYTQAITDLNQAIKLQPDYAWAYYNKARAYSLQRNVKAALENLQRAVDLDASFQKLAKTDADFNNIRQDRQFQTLIGQ